MIYPQCANSSERYAKEQARQVSVRNRQNRMTSRLVAQELARAGDGAGKIGKGHGGN